MLVLLAAGGCSNAQNGNAGSGGSAQSSGGASDGGAGSAGVGGNHASGGKGSGGEHATTKGGSTSTSTGGKAGAGGTTEAAGSSSEGGTPSSGGALTAGGDTASGGTQAAGGKTSSGGTGGSTAAQSALVTSTKGIWTSGTWTEADNATADVTVDDTATQQKWEGFGGAFHERGWNLLSTQALLDEALGLLFGADGARLSMGRIPIGASDYALERYTLDDTGTDVSAMTDESNRPAADLALTQFSIEHDKQTLIPYIKGALAVNPQLRFWAMPWTPPVWMKIQYNTMNLANPSSSAARPSYFDGGHMRNDAATLQSYAQYLVKFIQAYADQGIVIDKLSPQNEPTFEQNYPSCLWDAATFVSFVGNYLGPALQQATPGTKILIGSLSNDNTNGDLDLLDSVMKSPAAKAYVDSVGVQWGALAKLQQGGGSLPHDLPVWATEQRCGNYPFLYSPLSETDTSAPVNTYVEPPPNDQAYGIETWWFIHDAITKIKVSAYNLPHLVLDIMGKGLDTSRQWAQDSLLVVDGGKIIKTQAYYVVRHFSQFVDPGATVIGTDSAAAVAFKNPDGSLVTVVYSRMGKSDYTVAIGGKKLQFAIPAGGWATVKYKP